MSDDADPHGTPWTMRFSGRWADSDPDPSPAAQCQAVPCSHCGACAVYDDFHGNANGGCTDETCPLLKQSP